MEHLSDHDLERYHLGMMQGETELARFEEHLLACARCAARAEQAADYVDAMRAGSILGDFDLETDFSNRHAMGVYWVPLASKKGK